MESYKTDSYRRALAADHRLQALELVALALVGQCAGCSWEQVLKPLLEPLAGFGRNVPKQAEDPTPVDPEDPWGIDDIVSGAEIAAMVFPEAPEAETTTEAWLRTSEAYDAVSSVWLNYLEQSAPVATCILQLPA